MKLSSNLSKSTRLTPDFFALIHSLKSVSGVLASITIFITPSPLKGLGTTKSGRFVLDFPSLSTNEYDFWLK